MAGGGRHIARWLPAVRGFWFRPDADHQQGESYRIIKIPHVPVHLVNGYLCGDGGGGVYRAGLADENLPLCCRGDGAGKVVHLHRAGHRRGVGQTDVGHPVGVGRALTRSWCCCFYAGVIALWHAF